MSLKPVSPEALFAYQQNQTVLPLQQKNIVRETVRAAEASKKEREEREQKNKLKRLSTVG